MPKRSNDEVKEIEKWLHGHGFKPTSISGQSRDASWARGGCQVQVRRDEAIGYLVRIRPNSTSEWKDLDQVIYQLNKTEHWLVRMPIELAVSSFLGFEVSDPHSKGSRLYAVLQPWAYAFKIALQMLIGIGALAGLFWAIVHAQGNYHKSTTWQSETDLIIYIITAALSAAGAVELAYTLYTPGPDEALDPLMLGLSAGILLVITRSDIAVGWQFIGVVLGIISLWILFKIRHRFIDSSDLPHLMAREVEVLAQITRLGAA